ncbi:MAG: ATP-dependent 6-phosphofructokinase [Planctomycetota bacterium]|nr:ATP-dependent 6-phosphofructokinase [Planctomycetota bacterium]MCX8040759.1 ATP-dependent 6-phosphofructokinase [Planctomycetota bacterium]MDW8373719.1 ATP-dependent 6-phosphofructokinase [Planctomycetota bacterium]
MDPSAFQVARVRPATLPSTHRFAGRGQGPSVTYTPDDARVLVDTDPNGDRRLSFERAGPRERIAFDPARCTAAILTSGGLCPGLNAVISAIFMSLHHHYGVKRILGVPNGYAGLMPGRSRGIRPLDRDEMKAIARTGGSVLGSARLQPDVRAIVDTLQAYGIDMLFCIGGDGTQRGAHAIYEEVTRRGLEIAVVGVPKTIDNDICWVEKTFGFETAASIARDAIIAANTEAEAAINGIGLVKLMGRDSGFIAAEASIAAADVNYCLIPEVPFQLDGPHGLLAALEERLPRRGHAVIVVAEGAGQHLMPPGEERRDASGNLLHQDIGVFLRDRIAAHLTAKGIPHAIKYIDPSYIIRAAPANASDQVFCTMLGHAAAHAAMSGRTDMIVGSWNGQLTHVPIPLAIQGRRRVDPQGELWRTVLETTGQGPLCD